MVSKSYMLDKPSPPSNLKQKFDQRIVPAAIDLAAGMEMALERISVRTREQPLTALGAALASACALGLVTRWMLRVRSG